MSNESQESTNTTETRVFTTNHRNYTESDPEERWHWYCIKSYWKKQRYALHSDSKEEYRQRRGGYYRKVRTLRARIGNSDDIGAFAKLTSAYCLVGGGEESNNFCRTVQGDLREISVISTTLAGCSVTGRMCVGNKHGLIVPEATYDTELHKIKEQLPDCVKVQKIEERLSALGNVVVCNDHVALIHPELDKESEEIIANTLQVEVFRHVIANNPLVGSYSVLSNKGGLVCTGLSNTDLESLSSLLQLPLVAGTVNGGNKVVASGLLVNDLIVYAGMKTSVREFTDIDAAFRVNHS